jgi:hypothetical protein
VGRGSTRPNRPAIRPISSTRSLTLAVRLGFQPVNAFEEYGAEQALAVASLHSFKV